MGKRNESTMMNRRSMMIVSGSAIAASLAGCNGGPDEGTTQEGTTEPAGGEETTTAVPTTTRGPGESGTLTDEFEDLSKIDAFQDEGIWEAGVSGNQNCCDPGDDDRLKKTNEGTASWFQYQLPGDIKSFNVVLSVVQSAVNSDDPSQPGDFLTFEVSKDGEEWTSDVITLESSSEGSWHPDFIHDGTVSENGYRYLRITLGTTFTNSHAEFENLTIEYGP